MMIKFLFEIDSTPCPPLYLVILVAFLILKVKVSVKVSVNKGLHVYIGFV